MRRIFSLNLKAGDVFRWQYSPSTFLALVDGSAGEFAWHELYVIASSSNGAIFPLLIGRRDWVDVIE